MAAICLATGWSFRHNPSDRLLNRPALYAKESAAVGRSVTVHL